MFKRRKSWLLGPVGALLLVISATARAPTEELFGAYHFLLEVAGITSGDKEIIGGFKSMTGMDSETEVIEIMDSSGLHKLPGPTRYGNIIMRKGVTDPFPEFLWEWYAGISEGTSDPRDGSVVLLRNDVEVLRYNFFEAWPCKWKGFTLDGNGPDVFVEEIELCVEKVSRTVR